MSRVGGGATIPVSAVLHAKKQCLKLCHVQHSSAIRRIYRIISLAFVLEVIVQHSTEQYTT